MTNADCIRRMSDEQLYDFLSEWECGDIDYSITFCDLCKQGGNELNLDCDGCRKHWLQRDAVDFGGLMYWKRNTTFDTDSPQTDMPKCRNEKYYKSCEYEDNCNPTVCFKALDEFQEAVTDCDHKCIQTEVGCEQTDCLWK